ncbi:hypothetical protein K458DRAFT_405734 [Lentithecium fluviatile CBS 122367]|uniref:DUF6594 domain-containing protein n=1 Tax=Lentithecium fluviatile CBS 122367 TaxID=1168545 RepID=A0A6G1IW42_9PLEO|nr:hypothetical protein K458DRAFT_405734 [Lentithecium fluviatile CBS 122367]
MQARPSTRTPAFAFAQFYRDCASYPEIPKFRRLGAQWTKKLYDDLEELLKKEQELDRTIESAWRRDGGFPATFLDCPRSLAEGKQPLLEEWSKYEKLLRTYSKDLCLFNQLFQLPDHAPYFSKRLNLYSYLFHNGGFGPTDETGAAAAYQDPNSRDFVAAVGNDSSDILTNFVAYHVDWIEEHVLQRLRPLLRFGRPPQQVAQQTGVRWTTIVKTIDAFTCLFVPFMLTCTMFALARTRPPMVRIGVVGALGLVFSLSAKLISGKMSRGETFAFTAAFFAVASVFVSTTGDNISKAL